MRIISRAEWGARYRNGVGTRSIGKLEKYLHHSVTAHLSEHATIAQEMAQMRVLEQIGQQRFGGGISYPLVFFPSGRIYEGVSINRISYHSGGWRNTAGVGFCLAGNYETNKLNTKTFNAVVWALQHGVEQGWWGDPALTSYHKKFRSTACPGRYAIRQFNSINTAGRSGTLAPTTSTPKGTWFDMATPAELRKIVREEVRIASWAYKGKATKDAWAILREILAVVKNIRDNSRVRPWLYKGAKDDRDMHAVLKQTDRNVAAIKGTVDGLVEAVKQIDGVDPAEIGKQVNTGVSNALANLEADVSLNINTSEETPTETVATE